MAVVVAVAVGSGIVPVVGQWTCEEVVVVFLWISDGYGVYAYLEHNDTLAGCPLVALIRTHSCSGDSQQRRIAACLGRDIEYAIYTAAPAVVLEGDVIGQHIGCRALWQKLQMWHERCVACLGYGLCPESVEVFRALCRRLYLLR